MVYEQSRDQINLWKREMERERNRLLKSAEGEPAFRRGGSIKKKSHLLVTKYIYVSCSASCSETEEKLWDLWNVDLHREILEYINTRLTSNVKRKAEGGTFAGWKEQREVQCKP